MVGIQTGLVRLRRDSTVVSILTETTVRELVAQEYERAASMFPDWAHPYSGLRFSRSKRCFGQAHIDGTLVLSRSFLGTDASEDLLDTIRHEFAHLVVGIRHKHNERWRCAAASLGATPHARGNATNEALNEKMSEAPFTLVAVLRSGEERVLKPVHRRSRNYLNYRFNPFGQRYQLDGEWIDHFRYDDNRLSGKSA